jgi:hypothetical protein
LIAESDIIDFLTDYEAASNGRDFARLEPLIHPEATYRFSDGDFTGLHAIRGAIEQTWALEVEDERYWLTGIRIIRSGEDAALVMYDFHWSGVGPKGPFQVDGRGTQMLLRHDGRLTSLYEHLSH